MSGSSDEPRRPVAVAIPQHREERLVHREVAVPAVARVVRRRRSSRGSARSTAACARRAPSAATVPLRVRLRAVPRRVVVERAAAGLDHDRDDLELGHVRGLRVPNAGQPVLGRVELRPRGRRDCPSGSTPRTYAIGPGVGGRSRAATSSTSPSRAGRGSRRTSRPGGTRSPRSPAASTARCPAGSERRRTPSAAPASRLGSAPRAPAPRSPCPTSTRCRAAGFGPRDLGP